MNASPSLSQDRKFRVDVLWNIASLGVLGVSGIVLNVLIAGTVGAEALGVFNQVFAVYIFLSQLSVGGVHLSVMKHVSHHPRDRDTCAAITVSALVLCTFLATLFALLTWLASDWLGHLFDSPGVAVGLVLVSPGLIFFALNKVLLNGINGASAMRAYAVFQALRFVLILLGVSTIIASDLPGTYLAASLSVAELVLFPCLVLFTHLRLWSLWPSWTRRHWLQAHFSFGARGLLSGALNEINTRVDILMLGYFTSDAAVGIYSVAAIMAEGFSQLSIVLRRNVDPILGECFASGNLRRIEAEARKLRRWFWPAMLTLGGLAALLYPVAMGLLAGGDFSSSNHLFAILMLGVVLNASYRPFLGILLQSGHPGRHTLLVASLVLVNIVGNGLLIPWWGVTGAALATASVLVLEAVLIRLGARRFCGVRI